MKVMTMNVNGVRAAVTKGLWELVAEHAPDVVCLQEVRADLAAVPDAPPGYTACWHPAERKGYSGVGSLLRGEPRAVACGVGARVYDVEGRVQRLDLDGFTLVNVYVPSGTMGEPRQSFKMRFLKRFRSYVRGLLREGRELLIVGDVNIAHRPVDLKNWRSNQKTSGFLPEERAYLDAFLDLGLVDTVRSLVGEETELYTWWTMRAGARQRNVGWRLDYHFATRGLHARARGVEVPRFPVLSDHAPVLVEYDV